MNLNNMYFLNTVCQLNELPSVNVVSQLLNLIILRHSCTSRPILEPGTIQYCSFF